MLRSTSRRVLIGCVEMKIPTQILALASFALALLPWAAEATCTPSPPGRVVLNEMQIIDLVEDNTVCGRPGPSYPGDPADRWQEEHLANGQLWDYKRGPGDAVDPRTQVGTWNTEIGSRTAPATITHVYSPTVAFTWTVVGPPPGDNVAGTSVYSFCTTMGAEHALAFVIPGSGGCSSYPSPP